MDRFESYSIAQAAGIAAPETFLETPLVGNQFDDNSDLDLSDLSGAENAIMFVVRAVAAFSIVAVLAFLTISYL